MDKSRGAWMPPGILPKAVLAGLLVLLPGLLGYVTGNLWLFPSLGPTIYMQIMSPRQEASRFYNVAAGHMAGIFCGYSIALVSGAAYAPSAFGSGHLQLLHVVASCAAVALLILVQAPLKATHPPAASTALLIALGSFKATWHDFFVIVAGIVIIAAAGEAVRRTLISIEERGHGTGNGEEGEEK